MKKCNHNRLKKSDITFIDSPHSYKNKQGKIIIGVTTLLAKYGITKDLSNLPKRHLENIRKAAMRGTMVHEQIEDFDNIGIIPTDEWAKPYLNLNLNVLESEFLVNYENVYATKIDKILDDYSVCDIKTSNVVDIQGVAWQCSLGAYALEKQCNITVPKIYCIHLRDSKVNMFELERISNEEIEKLIDCEINNTLYNLPIPTKTDISLPDSLSTKAKRLYSAVSKINQLKERLDNEISEFMQDNNLYSLQADDISFTLVKPSISEIFDKKAFMKENPTIDLSPYNKISTRKGYLKIKIK